MHLHSSGQVAGLSGVTLATVLTLAHHALAATVQLPAGSVDGLAAAVTAAGSGGTVFVQSGVHDESGTATVTIPVTIVGEAGAEIRCGTLPAPTLVLLGGPPSPVTPTIHVLGTRDVRVQGLHFTAAFGTANCAVLIEDSSRVEIRGNHIDQFQSGVLVHHGDNVSVEENMIAIAPLWADPANPWALPQYFGVTQGINVINGQFARIVGNAVTGAGFGIFGNDAHGQMRNNTASGCLVGYILCHQLGLYSIGGLTVSADHAASLWHVQDNKAMGNYMVGYLAIDGAHHNTLANNAAAGNPLDMDLVGNVDYFGVGIVMPTCHDNVVAQASHKGLTIRDCGEGNVVSGDATIVACSY